MIWLAIAVLAAAALAPLALALRRRTAARGAKDLAVALHRAQLLELDRDLAEARIAAPEHATAVLEVQRRLLSAAAAAEGEGRPGSRWPVLAVAACVPFAALALYSVGGSPGMPSLSAEARMAEVQRLQQQAALVEQLRIRLARLDPQSDQARQGYVLLGNVEESRGNDEAAAAAWYTALQARFDATLAARAAEATVRTEGGVSARSAALFRQALDAAPGAPWREAVLARLQEPRLP